MNTQTSIEEIHIRKALHIQKDINSLPDNLRAIFDTCIAKEGCTQESALKEALIYGDIDNLSPELKAIAERYLLENESYQKSLREALVQEDINNLPPELKAIAEKYLSEGAFKTKAWNEVQVHLVIEQLPAHYKSIVDKYLSLDFSHSTALKKAQKEAKKLTQENLNQ
ncbi:MAG: hypothetical protein PHQ95_03230 [Candidatus Gracilibacteria bacterium]|nr:hypothetical protein [Candidatus Gracilibacteria bacterium]